MKSYVILGVFAIFCVHLTGWLADWHERTTAKKPAYLKAEVLALNNLVGELNEEETVKSTSHFSKGMLFMPKTEQEREEVVSYVFGRD